MKTIELGRTGLMISRLGLGGWVIGGSKWRRGWSNQEDSDSIATIERALALGMNWIDTAPAYGNGHSEDIIGRALAGAKSRPYLFTKCCALTLEGGQIVFSLEPDSIRRELEQSLKRLRVETIDLYQIHRPEPIDQLERGWEALVQARQEGIVRHIGVSNFTVDQLQRIKSYGPVETLQPPYSLIEPDAGDELLPYAQDEQIGVIAYSPMGSGLLTGTMTRERLNALPLSDWRTSDARFSEAKLERSFELVERLRIVGARHNASPGEVAVAWALSHPAVHGAIVGFRRAAQVDDIAAAASLVLLDDDLRLLEM